MKPIQTIALFFAIACSCWAQGQDESTDTVRTSFLDEVVVSANRIAEQRRVVAQQVEVVSSAAIQNLNAQSAADLIQNTGVVAMQKSQMGGGSPILRGFEASRVLMMIDGVRMNNLIYRAGHLQNIISVDSNMLERAEVLFGPSSTVYGSDALGGVVHFYTRNPELSSGGGLNLSANAFSRFGSANSERTNHLDVNLGGRRFASLTSFTHSDFGDQTMGERTNGALGQQFGLRTQYARRAADNLSDLLVQNGDPYRQVGSGYRQWDLLQKFLLATSDRVNHVVNFQFSDSTDIPRYDRLTDPQGTGLRYGDWHYGPQQRLMGSYQLQVKDLGTAADALNATASYQAIEESRYDRRFNSNNRNDRIENVKVWGLTVDFSKSYARNSLRYGFDGQFGSLKSTARLTDISTGTARALTTRYPDGDNTMNVLAVYATHTLRIADQWTLTDGLRLGNSTLDSSFVDRTFFPFPYDRIRQSPSFASGNLGVIYTPASWKFSLLAATGYRVPNVDDMAKVFETVAGTSTTIGTLVVPNPDLKPEKTVNVDFGVTRFFGDKVRWETTFFATDLTDALVVLPTTFNGQSRVTYGGFQANVISSQNAQKAYIVGYSTNLRADVSDRIALTASYNFTKGRVKSTPYETPLDHIAPAFGRIGVQYNTPRLKSEIFYNFSGWKRIEDYSASGEDNVVYAPTAGMPAWATINLRATYEINKMFALQAGVDNLTDLQYRMFASGINASGRNLFGTLRARM